MKPCQCSQERQVAEAARTGRWEEALAAHVRGCDICQDVARTAQWILAMVGSAEREGELSEARRVWQKASELKRLSRIEGVYRPLEVVEGFYLGVLTLILGVGIAWGWFGIEGQMAELVSQHWPIESWPPWLPPLPPGLMQSLGLGILLLLIWPFLIRPIVTSE